MKFKIPYYNPCKHGNEIGQSSTKKKQSKKIKSKETDEIINEHKTNRLL